MLECALTYSALAVDFVLEFGTLSVYRLDHTLAPSSEGGEVVSSHLTKEEPEKHRGCMTCRRHWRSQRAEMGARFGSDPLIPSTTIHSTFIFPRPWPTTSELLLRVQELGLGERGILYVPAAFKS